MLDVTVLQVVVFFLLGSEASYSLSSELILEFACVIGVYFASFSQIADDFLGLSFSIASSDEINNVRKVVPEARRRCLLSYWRIGSHGVYWDLVFFSFEFSCQIRKPFPQGFTVEGQCYLLGVRC